MLRASSHKQRRLHGRDSAHGPGTVTQRRHEHDSTVILPWAWGVIPRTRKSIDNGVSIPKVRGYAPRPIHWARADAFHAVFAACQRRGIPAVDLVHRAGLAAERYPWVKASVAEQRNLYVSRTEWTVLMTQANELIGQSSSAAANAAIAIPGLDELGDLGHLLATASDVGAAVELIGPSFKLLGAGAGWRATTDGQLCTLELELSGSHPPFGRDALMLHMIRYVLGQLSDPAVPLVRIDLRGPRTAGVGRAVAVGAREVPVVFEAERDALHIQREALAQPTRHAHSTMHQRFRELVDTQLHGVVTNPQVVAHVQTVFRQHHGELSLTLAEVAHRVGLSPRRLQRALAEDDTDFSAELDSHRRTVAQQKVRWTHIPLTELAYAMGFSSSAAFSRAYRRWMGVSPREDRCAIARARQA